MLLMAERNGELKNAFRQWFLRRWAAWDADQGQRSTQDQLAAYLGISRSSVAQYVSGSQVPTQESADKIASRWPDVYEAAGLPVPDSALTVDQKAERILDMMERTPAEEQDKLLALLDEFLTLKGYRRIK